MGCTGWLTIFYEPTNWFAFVYYFLVGALSGYVRLTKDDKIKFLTDGIDLLEEKLEFTRERNGYGKKISVSLPSTSA